jgi:D-alanyl-lipoteichoic acid acyltransferase DltB (MBOAT superfamily)|nr:Probable poly(beta-D-mannuronate) O-acetylase (EC [uncultured bacterium]
MIPAISLRYGTLAFYIFLAACCVLYYCFPKKLRWAVLLAASCFFYVSVSTAPLQLIWFAASIAVSYLFSRLLERQAAGPENGRTEIDGTGNVGTGFAKSRALLTAGIVLTALPLVGTKCLYFIPGMTFSGLLLPVGLSFYTLQAVSYLADIAKGRIRAEKNPLRYALYISFFPQIIQGPIPRYNRLGAQLNEGHAFDMDNIMQGIRLSLWGFFLKLMIADKAGIVVNEVFDHYQVYNGGLYLLAALLYSIQLYADFQACVKMSQGMARCFGITLDENFARPYFAQSVKEFWRRWHITLSTWLRDYIYIPLGGNRKGKAARYLFLLITFLVSGFWHGNGVHFLFWGLLHALFQILGEIVPALWKRLFGKVPAVSAGIRRILTFLLVSAAWIFFRADSIRQGAFMLRSVFTDPSPWIFLNDSLFWLIMDGKEWIVLLLSVAVLFFVSFTQERGHAVSSWVQTRRLPLRWLIYLCVIWAIWIFGSYGTGFSAGDFIYGGF